MHRARKVVGLAVVFAMAVSLMAVMAAPAQAAAGANVNFLNPYQNGQTLSSRDGLLTELTAVANGGDDWSAATQAFFYVRNPAPPFNFAWHLLGSDSTPTMPDSSPGFGLGVSGNPPRPVAPIGPNHNWKGFNIKVDTRALPGGITSLADFLVVICGEGTTSLDAFGAFNAQDKNVTPPIGPFVSTNCDNQAALTPLGQDVVSGVVISNLFPVVNAADFPGNGYHGDSLPAGGFTLNFTTTDDVDLVQVSMCNNVNPEVAGLPGRGDASTVSPTPAGPCLIDAVPAFGGPTNWSLSFSFGGAPGTIAIPAGLLARPIRLEVAATDIFVGTTWTNHYIQIHPGLQDVESIKAVWDYQDGPGDRTCQRGASAGTSPIDPWRLTDSDGDGTEGLATAPAPDSGFLDIDDGDNPVLKVCALGNTAGSVQMPEIQIAWEIVAGPGGIDADSPTYKDPGIFPCAAGTPFCSGGFGTFGTSIHGGSYSRPGSVFDAPLFDPLGRATSRICALAGHCQRGDITDGFNFAVPGWNGFQEFGVDFAAVNSLTAGTTTYRTCVDKDGDNACGANDGPSALATMAWTPAGRNHNHAWKAGTASADGHSGTSTVPAPAGSTVSLEGWLHDAGHNGVANKPVIWRIGLNAPGHFVSSSTTSDGTGKATAVIGSSVLDAARTTPVFFCGDGDADGICDFTPAQVEINWGGVVTSTAISNFSVTPTIGVFGTDFVVSGKLLDGSSAPVSSATVTIQRRTLGSNDWTDIRNIITNGTGSFSMTDVDLAFNSDYRAVFAGNVSYTGSTSNSARAWVREGIAMNVSDTTVFSGQTVRISGRALPAHPGDVVILQALDNGRGWKNVASTRLSASSTYAFTVTQHASKSILYRVAYPTQGNLNAWNVSRNVRITWA